MKRSLLYFIAILLSSRCVKDFLMHYHEIIGIIWKILAVCVQFTNYLNMLATDFNQKFQTYVKSHQVRKTYREAAAKNVLKTLVEGDFEKVIKAQHKTFNSLLDQFINSVARLTRDTDPDHKTNSLIIRLKLYTRIGYNLNAPIP